MLKTRSLARVRNTSNPYPAMEETSSASRVVTAEIRAELPSERKKPVPGAKRFCRFCIRLPPKVIAPRLTSTVVLVAQTIIQKKGKIEMTDKRTRKTYRRTAEGRSLRSDL